MFVRERPETVTLKLNACRVKASSVALLCVLVIGGCAAAVVRDAPAGEPGGIHLLNGQNLEGFYTYLRGYGRDHDPNRVFTVADGAIRISGQDWGCLTTNDLYEDYRLIAEYRWGNETYTPREASARDNGI